MFYLHDEPRCLKFTLLGRLDPEEWSDLESCRRTAESIRRGRPLVLDVTRLTDLDGPAREALDRLCASGAILFGYGGDGRERGHESMWQRWCAAIRRGSRQRRSGDSLLNKALRESGNLPDAGRVNTDVYSDTLIESWAPRVKWPVAPMANELDRS